MAKCMLEGPMNRSYIVSVADKKILLIPTEMKWQKRILGKEAKLILILHMSLQIKIISGASYGLKTSLAKIYFTDGF